MSNICGRATPGLELPLDLVDFARALLARVRSARIVWIIGLPGAGKSTLLAACRQADDTVETLELMDELDKMGITEGPPRPGGLTSLGVAARRVRTSAAKRGVLTLISTTGIPVDAVPPTPGEVLLVLGTAPERAEVQLRNRPPRSARTAAASEIPMHQQIVQRLADLPHAQIVSVPMIPSLLGRAAL